MPNPFKVGDIVECIDDDELETTSIERGSIYKVLYRDFYSITIENDDGEEEHYSYSRFDLSERYIPVTESEFLDCFQRNFKDGI